jgi:hypothetical protein
MAARLVVPGETPYRIFVLTNAYPTEFKYSILVHAKPIDNEECIFRYYPTTVDSTIPYMNKLEWGVSTVPKHNFIPCFYTFGFLHHIFIYFENSSVPESSNCLTTTSVSSFSSSQSENNVSLNTPQIKRVFPIKKLE